MTTMWTFLIVITGLLTILHSARTLQKTSNLVTQIMTYDDRDKFYVVTNKMSELLETCDQEKIKFFGLVTDITKYTRWSYGFLKKFGLVQIKYTILGDVKVFPAIRRPQQAHHTKLDAFVVIADSATNLEYMLHRLRMTKWWNTEGFCFVLDSETINTGCKNAQSFLYQSWNVNILSSFFLCLDDNEQVVIYTYNPYANRAPKSWKKVPVLNKELVGETWTLFSRAFIPDDTSCDVLKFDKTFRLDGYEYKVVGISLPPAFHVSTDANGKIIYGGLDAKIHRLFAKVLNASFSPTITLDQDIGWVESNGVAHDLLANVSAGHYDALVNSVYMFNKYHTTMTYPHLDTGLAILTKFTGVESEQAKILKFMNPILVRSITLIAVFTIFVLGILNHYGLSQASLEVMRLITNTTMSYRIRGTPLRFYIITVVFLFLITNAAFQCNLAAILTKPLNKPNIENMEDLRASGYVVYAGMEFKHMLDDPVLKPRMRLTPNWNCSKHVMYEENVACVADIYELMKIAIDGRMFNFYLSSNTIMSMTSAYVARPDWPLRERFNEILSRLFEGGILDLWKRKDAEIYLQNSQMYKSWAKERTVRRLTITNLAFAFVWLTIGLTWSTLAFFAECAYSYYQIRKKPKTVFPFVQ